MSESCHITLDLHIDKVKDFVDQLPDDCKIHGGSINSCCLSLYAIFVIEGLSISQDLDTEYYLSFLSRGYIDCDFNRLQYWTVLDTASPTFEIPLPAWCKKFNFEQKKLGIAKASEFKALLTKLRDMLNDPRLVKFWK